MSFAAYHMGSEIRAWESYCRVRCNNLLWKYGNLTILMHGSNYATTLAIHQIVCNLETSEYKPIVLVRSSGILSLIGFLTSTEISQGHCERRKGRAAFSAWNHSMYILNDLFHWSCYLFMHIFTCLTSFSLDFELIIYRGQNLRESLHDSAELFMDIFLHTWRVVILDFELTLYRG